MTRASLVLLGAMTLAVGQMVGSAQADPAPRPNIIFVLCDDLGPGDIGVLWQNGRPETRRHRTPHLDQFAAEEPAEACFQNALKVSREQSAKSFELRAATSMSRLWQKQDKNDEARQMLTEIYGWFTEGFDTYDLKQAKLLLEELV